MTQGSRTSSNKAKRRFEDHKPAGKPMTLAPTHNAIVKGTTLFPSRIQTPIELVSLFKSGVNSRKIGSHVTKGKWKGMPIYTLTLEERATCPTVCEHWFDCFGNKMHWSTRWKAGPELEKLIPEQISMLAKKHPKGFVVRLHVLGDFYSTRYVSIWHNLIAEYPQLHIFGYTRWRPKSDAKGEWIAALNNIFADRFAIRFSEAGGEMGTVTLKDVTLRGKVPEGIVCPAQTGDADCCGSCGLCWNTTKPIVFLNH